MCCRFGKDLNCVACQQKLLGKGKSILKELLIDEEEDPQVAIEMTEIPEEKVYERIQADLDKLPEHKQKELRMHIQGILQSNALVHRHTVEATNHLADASHVLSTPGMVVLAQSTARPLIRVYLPLMNTFIEEARKKHEETLQQRKNEYRPIDEICIDQNLPCLAREWEYQQEGPANSRLGAVVTRYIHEAMMRDKKQFYSGNILGTMFKVPPSMLNKLLSGQKYMGGAELEKYRGNEKEKCRHTKMKRNKIRRMKGVVTTKGFYINIQTDCNGTRITKTQGMTGE